MKTVLIYSGGLDSTVLLFDLLRKGDEVHALFVGYGQRHRKELSAVVDIALKSAGNIGLRTSPLCETSWAEQSAKKPILDYLPSRAATRIPIR
jgi:7-cyano-7-deazaguanine synthase in queuosine biosynthesis